MKSTTRIIMMSLLALAAVAGPAWAQAKSELMIALSSFSAETVDPALQGHNVEYYLSLMCDYLVGTTPDGEPPPAGGLASQWENSADRERWTIQLTNGGNCHQGTELRREQA